MQRGCSLGGISIRFKVQISLGTNNSGVLLDPYRGSALHGFGVCPIGVGTRNALPWTVPRHIKKKRRVGSTSLWVREAVSALGGGYFTVPSIKSSGLKIWCYDLVVIQCVRGGGTGIAESAVSGDEGVGFSEEVAGSAEAAGAEGEYSRRGDWEGGGFVEFHNDYSGLDLLERSSSRCWVSFHQHSQRDFNLVDREQVVPST